MSELIKAVTDGEFETEVINSGTPTVVDFWAEWCGPCKAMAPVLDEVAQAAGGKVNFRKINIDENQAVPQKYGIKGIPTLILFKDGQPVDQVVGNVGKGQIEALLSKA